MAFDEHRPFKSCIFCGNPKKAELTKEHIFGKAVARRFPVKHNWETSGKSFFGPTVAKGGGPITSVTASLACGDCNKGTLKKDMDNSLESLMRLIDGTSHQITAPDWAALARYWERVGLIDDVMTSNYQITANYAAGDEYALSREDRQTPPLYSQAKREAWTKGGPLLDMHIYIGFHPGVLGLNPTVSTASSWAGYTDEGSTTERRFVVEKRFLMTIGKLSVCVWMGKNHLDVPIPLRLSVIGNPPPIPTSFRDLAIANQNWDWPGAVPPVSYPDFFGLYNQTPDVQLITRIMGIQTLRQKVEDFSRQEGTFSAPPDLHQMYQIYAKGEDRRGAYSPPRTP